VADRGETGREARQPKVTVVTPSFNQCEFLPTTIRSVLAQDYPDLEYIIIDGGSSDGSVDVIRSFEARLAGWVSEPDRGQSHGLNKGFAMATGDVLCWLNADDIWLHERVVSEAVSALRNADVVTGGGWYVGRHGERKVRVAAKPRRVLKELRYHDLVLQTATFWRRAVHVPLREDLEYIMDWELFLRMQLAGARFRVVPNEWGGHRDWGANKTATDPSLRRAEIADLLRDQFGRWSPQHAWARSVWAGYRLAERTGAPGLKRGVRAVNSFMGWATDGKVYSA
jgi:glycosyltransferase involved in cell wall biosynthesis